MRLASLAVASLAILITGGSCSLQSRDDPERHQQSDAQGQSASLGRPVTVAPGVRYRSIPGDDAITGGSPVWLVDADLGVRGTIVRVVSSGLRAGESPRLGTCYDAAGWCAVTGGVAAVNGGYFGAGDDKRKEIVGLLVENGTVESSASQRRGSHGTYVRSVFGIGRDGSPAIRWATGRRGRKAELSWYADPEQAEASGTWSVREAVGCGPTLVVGGKVRVTDRAERLVSPGRLPRTFVGYSVRAGKPDRLILAVAQAMEYTEAAAFMVEYFRREHDAMCERAMCLDGGGSSQLACVADGNVLMPTPAFVTVPTAIVIKASTTGAEEGS